MTFLALEPYAIASTDFYKARVCLIVKAVLNARESKMERNTHGNNTEYDLKYSRLLAVLEHKGLRALQSSKILIVGATGLGIEIAKNLVMMGASGVCIQDDRIVRATDISTSILLKDEDIGKNIADIAIIRLAEINKDVRVQIHNENSLEGFDLVCLTKVASEDDINHINMQCRLNKTPLVVGETFGVFGFVFNDFNEHLVLAIENSDESSHSYYDVHSPTNNILQFGPFSQFMTTKLSPKKVLCYDGTKAHNFFPTLRALLKFRQQHGRDPESYNSEESNMVVAQAKQFEANLDEQLVSRLAQVSAISFAPVISLIGGTMTLEIVKALTHYGTPVDQFMFYECSDVLPEVPPTLGSGQKNAGSARYDGLTALFGHESVKRIHESKVLVAGAGSVGSEVLKILTTLGVASDRNGEIAIRDDGTVHLHHLCSQMLYRTEDIGKNKAEVAAERVGQISNTKLNITSCATSVEDEHCDLSPYDVVINASPQREKVDELIVRFIKPLIDCAASGTKGHVDATYPHVTEKPSLKVMHLIGEDEGWGVYAWPFLFERCAIWAQRYVFERYFCSGIAYIRSCLTQPKDGEVNGAIASIALSAKGCITWGLEEFYQRFHRKLIDRFTECGPYDPVPYNVSLKTNMPITFLFNRDDPLHVTFALTAASLMAQAVGIEPSRQFNREFLEEVLKEHQDGEDAGKEVFKIGTVETLIREVETRSLTLKPIQTDLENNIEHLSMVHTAARLWARVFGIHNDESMVPTLMTVNKSQPKIVPTSSIIASLAVIEFLKMRTKTQIQPSTLRNSFINTNIPIVSQYSPMSPSFKEFRSIRFTAWDLVEIDEGDLTFEQLENYFKLKYDLEVLAIDAVDATLSSWTFFSKKSSSRKISERYKEVTEKMSVNSFELDLKVDYELSGTLPRFIYRWRDSLLTCETWLNTE